MRWSVMLVSALGCGSSPAMPPGDGAQPDVPVLDEAPDDSAQADAPPDVIPPSCVGLAATCGTTAASSCCRSELVPGGAFHRSYDLATDGLHAQMNAPATVSTFRLDTYEITVGRFRTFVAAGGGTQQNPPTAGAGARTLGGVANQGGWEASWNTLLAATPAALMTDLACSSEWATWTDAPGANEQRPINCISWFEAMAFCIWDGGFLPTEAQWNFAAAGGEQQRAYPWSVPAGDLTVTPSHTSYYVDGTSQCMGDGVAGCTVTDLVPVGSQPAGNGLWGHADLGGNVAEWVLDWSVSYASPCDDCAQLTPPSLRALRGGGFRSTVTELRSGFRGDGGAAAHYNIVGARCARLP